MSTLDIYFLRTFVVPIIALLTPIFLLFYRKIKYNLKIALEKRIILRFVLVWVVLSSFIYSVLIFVTGGVNTFLFLEKGFFYDDRGLSWNATTHLNITIPYDPGTSLLVVAILSGVLYSSLLTLPKICTILPNKISNPDLEASTSSTSGKTASLSSSISSTASAFASTAVCCSTSIVAVIAPSIGVILGPFVPGLLMGSFALLIYSFHSVVLPRFPIISGD